MMVMAAGEVAEVVEAGVMVSVALEAPAVLAVIVLMASVVALEADVLNEDTDCLSFVFVNQFVGAGGQFQFVAVFPDE